MTSPREPRQRPAVRHDAEGHLAIGPTWESLVERLIREAQEQGAFDDLPGRGRPITVDDAPYAADMALANHLLRNAGAAPPWIESDKAVRAAAEQIDALMAEAGRATVEGRLGPLGRDRLAARLEQCMDAHDAAVTRLASEAPAPSLHRRPLDRAAQRTRLRATLDGRP